MNQARLTYYFTLPKILPKNLPVFLLLLINCVIGKIDINRSGCGETKGCLFKPAGCDPQLDCTMGIVFFVTEPNQLRIQMVAQSLLPAPQYQYLAVGFSKDALMGDDFVSECVMSPDTSAFADVEVFASYNNRNSNDRTQLNGTEHSVLYNQIEGEVEDGRLTCQFDQQILPQLRGKGTLLWNLNRKYFVIGATGSAQPDEINVHDISVGSHFYPLVSARPIDPSLIGKTLFELPAPMIVDSATSMFNSVLLRPAPNNETEAQEQSTGLQASAAALVRGNYLCILLIGWMFSQRVLLAAVLH